MKEFQLLSTEETENLINLAKLGDCDAKQKLLNGNYPLIKSIVKRYIGKGVEYDDLYQLGCVGFLKAINNFSSKFSVKFSTYAVPMIAGEIKRFLRDDGAIKISRTIKSLSVKINRYLDEQRKIDNKAPTIKELAEKFEASEEDIVIAMDSSQSLISIYEKTVDKTSDNSPNLLDQLVVDESLDEKIDKIILKDLINKLPEREKKIIMLRYFRGKTQTEIARMLDVSQVQVSRIEAKVLANFKEKFEQK